MPVPWIEEAGLPVEADDPLTLHFIANDDDEWGSADDWDRLHAQFQQHGVLYRVIVSPQLLPPSEDPFGTDETAWGSIAHCNPSFFNR
jgi:hypothetical protein